jgi:hypothetical protein
MSRISIFSGSIALLAFANQLPAQVLATPTLVQPNVIISVRDQSLVLLQNGAKIASYPVSTSKYGLGDNWGAMTTPTGLLQVAQKIGDHAPVGAVFHKRRFTGEILQPNAPGRDPVITRIIWLRGLQTENAHAFNRCIYIHGTPEEKFIGKPASYGCIRMKSSDVAALYAQLPLGAVVQITPEKLPKISPASKATLVQAKTPATPTPTHAVFTADSSKPGAEKATITPLAPKTPTAPVKKPAASLQNERA